VGQNLENIKNLPRNMRRHREERRKLLTRGELAFYRTYLLLGPLLFPAGVVLLLSGGAKAVGISLLVLALLVNAIPISPFLRARGKRREAQTKRD
jgi:hypothetical protein